MNWTDTLSKKLAVFGIAALCFGYFASYVPYSMMTKMITKGLFAGQNGVGVNGFIILPVSVFGSVAAMYLFLTLAGWWKYSQKKKILGLTLPWPRWFTLISGLCTSGVIITTTLAYTFSGISIVFAMLLMRGGVLVIAPVVDLLAIKRKRKIYWPSWVAAGLSFGALFVSFSGHDTALTLIAALDIFFYILSYFLRLIIMSNSAKSTNVEEKKAYFTEEQLVASPALLLGLLVVAVVGAGMPAEALPNILWRGFVEFPFQGYFWTTFFIGVLSSGTGLFGGLIFLDRRENTFTVPANRCSSVIAGIVATYLLHQFYAQKPLPSDEWLGVTLIMAAIIFLAYRSIVEKRRKKQRELFPEMVPQPLVQQGAETN